MSRLVGFLCGFVLMVGSMAGSMVGSMVASMSSSLADESGAPAPPPPPSGYERLDGDGYTAEQVLEEGHRFLGQTTGGFARIVEHLFEELGPPSAYIVGEEASGAFFAGVRYGEGRLHLASGESSKIYWQGPSLGIDLGANGSRTMALVYYLDDPDEIYDTYTGMEGSFYFVGGAGVNFQRSENLMIAPIRTGVGARAGANIGYLKYSREPLLNPF